MKLARPHAAILMGAAVAALSLSASPAFAEPGHALPSGSSLYAIDCDDMGDQLYSIDTTNAQATLVGSGGVTANCAGPGAWNPVTGLAYYIDWSGFNNALRSMDVATGVSNPVGPFTIGGAPGNGIYAMAIGTDGAAYAIVYTGSLSILYSIDLSTAALTPVGPLGPASERLYSMSVDPTTGLFYGARFDGTIVEIDVTTGATTVVGTVNLDNSGDNDPATNDNSLYSMTIDSKGIIWIENDGQLSDLWSVDLSDIGGSQQFHGVIARDAADPATRFYTESVFVAPTAGIAPVAAAPAVTPAAATPSPQLAETGVDETRTLALLGGSAVGLLLGMGLVVVSRRRKQRA